MDNITIEELKILKRVMETNNITQTANELYINQPTISKMIKRVENQNNIQIFNRKRGFTLTNEGEIFYSYIIDLLTTWKSLEQHISEQNTNYISKIHIGLPPIIGSFLFPKIITSFINTYPFIENIIYEGGGLKIEEGLLKGDIDVGFAVLPTKNPSLKSHIIYRDVFVICMSEKHTLAKYDEIDFADLKNERFICFRNDFMIHQYFLKMCEESAFEPNIVLNSSQWDLILELVGVNFGIAIVPRILISKFERENMKEIKIKTPNIPWEIGIIYSDANYLSIAAKNFIEIARDTYKF
ncbi:LysR family transcriptional regulator [Fredinandcohnia onubensis]|uniref:LysR family transcriptional regulator n=1 Tax=Fredinandcohnia onubensis TaxID=1571209 RepID=UPI000C0C0F66|nr:LysR family transcriptional regulator [Fredinandcohnia onubensis]